MCQTWPELWIAPSKQFCLQPSLECWQWWRRCDISWQTVKWILIAANSQLKHYLNEKVLREMQTLCTGCSKAEPKIFIFHPSAGAQDGQNLISWRWSLPSSTKPVWWRSMHAILSYHGNRPTHTHTHKHTQTNPQTGLITIHCAAKLSAKCNNSCQSCVYDCHKHSSA